MKAVQVTADSNGWLSSDRPGLHTDQQPSMERRIARSSPKLRPVLEGNRFEALRGCLRQGHAISFHLAIAALCEGGAGAPAHRLTG